MRVLGDDPEDYIGNWELGPLSSGQGKVDAICRSRSDRAKVTACRLHLSLLASFAPASFFGGQLATGTRRVAGTTHTKSGRR